MFKYSPTKLNAHFVRNICQSENIDRVELKPETSLMQKLNNMHF